MTGSRELVARERRQALPAAISAMVAVVFLAGSSFLVTRVLAGADGEAEALREIDASQATIILSFALVALGFIALAPPIAYLFRAGSERRDSPHARLILAIWASPFFLAAAVVFFGISQLGAAADFVAQGILGADDAANEAARDTLAEQSTGFLAIGFMLAGAIGFSVGMGYTCYQAMKAGLLTKLTGSIGTALGAISLFSFMSFLTYQLSFFNIFTLLWFIYLGLLIAGWLPGGRPPAWAEGRAIPWPRPGERIAEEYFPDTDQGSDQTEPNGENAAADELGGEGGISAPGEARSGVRKRKRRA